MRLWLIGGFRRAAAGGVEWNGDGDGDGDGGGECGRFCPASSAVGQLAPVSNAFRT